MTEQESASTSGERTDEVHVTDDVVIPRELIDAHHDGDLVVFVGAGVSMGAPSCLPSFRKLAIDLAEMACVPFRDEDGSEEDEPHELDRFLGRMPKDFNLQHHALELVSKKGTSPNSTHDVIMRLAASGGGLRVVTTNYDDHLAGAAEKAGIEIPGRWDAPFLWQ